MDTEMANHKRNCSWTVISESELPKGRRAHKFTWVFKLKRDGTAKGRLCVQGCTLREGIDYDQVFTLQRCATAPAARSSPTRLARAAASAA